MSDTGTIEEAKSATVGIVVESQLQSRNGGGTAADVLRRGVVENEDPAVLLRHVADKEPGTLSKNT